MKLDARLSKTFASAYVEPRYDPSTMPLLPLSSRLWTPVLSGALIVAMSVVGAGCGSSTVPRSAPVPAPDSHPTATVPSPIDPSEPSEPSEPSAPAPSAPKAEALAAWTTPQRERFTTVLGVPPTYTRAPTATGPVITAAARPLLHATAHWAQGNDSSQTQDTVTLHFPSSTRVDVHDASGATMILAWVQGVLEVIAPAIPAPAGWLDGVRDASLLRTALLSGPWSPGSTVNLAGEAYTCLGTNDATIWLVPVAEFRDAPTAAHEAGPAHEASPAGVAYPVEPGQLNHVELHLRPDGTAVSAVRLLGTRDADTGTLFVRRTTLESLSYE